METQELAVKIHTNVHPFSYSETARCAVELLVEKKQLEAKVPISRVTGQVPD
ncbi:MAG TPA: hypothetical protein VGR03_11165 [Candidatus Acidoferrum sp.]|nr:hypothetical protein [Candidatus Acidoferrum sp.]